MPEHPSRRPPEIAREALRRLARDQMPPTPENYRTVYHRIAGTSEEDDFPELPLKLVAAALPRDTQEDLSRAQALEHAIASRKWLAVRRAVVDLCRPRVNGHPAWDTLLQELVTQLAPSDPPRIGHLRRWEVLQHALSKGSHMADQLFDRLETLVRIWAREAIADGAAGPGDHTHEAIGGPESPETVAPAAPVAALLRQLLARGVGPLVAGNPELCREVQAIAEAVAELEFSGTDETLAARIDAVTDQLGWAGEDQRAVREALIGLLRLIVDNISELVIDDQWLRGQLTLLAAAFNESLDIRVLDEVERRLRDVIDKQRHLKLELTDAQKRLKGMLVVFVDRLAEFGESTGRYQNHLERCARHISDAHDLAELADVVGEMLDETRTIQETARRSNAELGSLRAEVEAAHEHIARLQHELDETSELVRHDPLTGVLNRKGLDEALDRELARARRSGANLCVAMLDIDNFKALNDTYGHKTGDAALRHLSQVVAETLRPQDVVSRYGGEEFLILLPETDVKNGATTLERLQRELTKRFFLTDNRRLLITFSAGITLMRPDEDPYAAIDRADKAMYAAKRAGKNRVLTAA